MTVTSFHSIYGIFGFLKIQRLAKEPTIVFTCPITISSSRETMVSKRMLDQCLKGMKPGSQACEAVLRSFDRVQLLEEKGETSAGLSRGDLNGDGLPDIVLGKGRHWPLFNRALLNDGHGGFVQSSGIPARSP